ncbi:hypothetical protein NUSPORA_01245 [Nucleospora cyclopteri]
MICKKKLFTGRKITDSTIYEFLAKEGISIAVANESSKSVDQAQKELIEDAFGVKTVILYRSMHDVEIQPIEHFFLITFFLHSDRPLDAFLCFSKRKLLGSIKYIQMAQQTFQVFREMAKKIRKAGNLMIFSTARSGLFRVGEFLDKNIIFIVERICTIYLRFKYEDEFHALVVIEEGNEKTLVSSSCDFTVIEREIIIREQEEMITIRDEDFKEVLKQLI